MSDKPKLKPYEADADLSDLTYLPGDEPQPPRAVKSSRPAEYDLSEVVLVDEGVELPSIAQAPKPSRFWSLGSSFAVFFFLFSIGFLAYQSVRVVLDAFVWWAPTGVLLGLLFAGVVITSVIAVTRELGRIRRQMRSLGTIRSAQREANSLLLSTGHDRGVAFAARVIRIYESRPEMVEPIRAFRQAVNSSLRDQEVVARLSSHVLRHLDDQARTVIGRALRDTAFISLASPNGLVDSLLTLWRELKLLREIAVTYGLAPGLIQQWTLLRRVLSIASTSGLANQAGDMAVQSLGGGIISRLSANAADALYTALRTARLGMYAMETCRPVTFVPEERRGMWILLRKAVRSVLTLVASGATNPDTNISVSSP
jgi:putative membrane protein